MLPVLSAAFFPRGIQLDGLSIIENGKVASRAHKVQVTRVSRKALLYSTSRGFE